jgi:pantoate--beta-alanine ligase
VREADGLAMSSRNTRLSVEERTTALNISRILFESQKYAKVHTLAETQSFVEEGIAAIEGLRLEYYEVVDDRTLQTVREWDEVEGIVGCITVFCGDVRLIDNIRYK